eukprot:15452598-Alexandrium_andersonii.AAC.1
MPARMAMSSLVKNFGRAKSNWTTGKCDLELWCERHCPSLDAVAAPVLQGVVREVVQHAL